MAHSQQQTVLSKMHNAKGCDMQSSSTNRLLTIRSQAKYTVTISFNTDDLTEDTNCAEELLYHLSQELPTSGVINKDTVITVKDNESTREFSNTIQPIC